MKHKLQKIKEETQSLCSEISSDLQSAQNNIRQIGDEYHRVTVYSRNSMAMLEEIDAKFEKATKLTKMDTAFLFTATALQCLRQYFLTPLTERKGHQEAADEVKEKKEHSDRTHRLYNPSLEEIISNPVPFDATMGSKRYGALSGFNGPDHRYATPGHDPVLGLLFGTANIATSTLTNWRIESFHIYTGTIGLAKGNHDIFTQRAQTPLVFSNLFDKLLHQGVYGKKIVAVSVLKEIQHLRSDVYSKDSLPLPVISAINPSLAGELATRGLDMATVLDVGKQLAVAVAIDTLIALIHGLFYDESDGISRSMYEVRTRRILTYSNLIASASNVIAAALTECLGANGARIVDWGGYINTVRRIAMDTKFIHEIKKDFLKNELYDRIVGEEYDFMKGDF